MEITDDIREISKQIADLYRANIVKGNAVATGELQRFTWNCRFSGGFYILEFTMPSYWKYAPENSRISHKQPPVDAIVEWIKAKHLPVPTTKQGLPDYKGPAYCIARKIGKFGWAKQPRKLLQNSMSEADTSGLIGKLTTAIFASLSEEINDEIKDL